MKTLFDSIVNHHRRLEHPKDREELDTSDLWVPKTSRFTHRTPETLWDSFAHSLQYERRFIQVDSDPEVIPPQDWLPEFFEDLDLQIEVGSLWFRCRDKVSEAGVEPLPVSEMGAPPSSLATAGRANPVGIPFLYLSSDETTCVAETRVAKGRTVSVAKFEITSQTRVIDLTQVPYLDSPFGRSEGMLPFLVERVGIIRQLAVELSQPIDPKASEIDYLPTQYLAEVIRDQGYDGVLFNSAMGDGQNLVLFDLVNG